MLFADRNPDNYSEKSTYRIGGSLHVTEDRLYGLRELCDRRWVDTDVQIIWSAPPANDNAPDDYDGGRAVIVMAQGDQTELLPQGAKIKLRREIDGDAYPKEYVISEVGVRALHIADNDPYAMSDQWRDREEVFTHIALLHLDYTDLSYEEQARFEMSGKYITVVRALERRSEIWSLER